MKALPPPTRSLVIVRQLSMPFDPQKLTGMSATQRALVIVRLANVLMAASGVVKEESGDDEQ